MKIPQSLLSSLVLIFLAGGFGSAKAENKAATNSPQVRSIFILPATVKDGRDPFFPTSTRMIEAAAAANKTIEINTLKVPGISGTAGHLLAIINNHTFAVGDEGDVMTPSGRVHVRCLEIHHDSVLVEVNGHPQRLNLESQ